MQEHIDALNDLQDRFEAQSAQLRAVRHERDEVVRLHASATAKNEAQSTNIGNLKSESDTLRGLIESLRQTLMIPPEETAQVEALRQAAVEKKKAEERYARLEQDFNFVKDQYQSASGAAADLAAQNKNLTSDLAQATRRASGEAARLRQMHLDKRAQAFADRTKMLEAMLRDREDLLRKKEEEIKVLRGRGALGTRSTSVPRSPRVGPNSGSRGASPVVGGQGSRLAMHPLRNG